MRNRAERMPRGSRSWQAWGLGLCLLWVAAACGEETPAIDAAPEPDATPPTGRLLFSWTISDGSGPTDCDTVGANTVTMVARPRAGGFAAIDAVDCSGGSLTSRAIPAAEYDVDLELKAAEGTLATVEVGRITVEVGVDKTIDPVEFVVDPTGGVQFRIDASADPATCGAVEAGGLGVTEMSIELTGPGGTCLPVTFSIAAGATGAEGSYPADCDGTRHACIDADQVLEATGLTAGEYMMAIAAYRGDLACFTATVPLAVPGGGLLADRGTFRLPLTSKDPGCL